MKRFAVLFLLALAVVQPALALNTKKATATGGAPFPTAYATTSASMVMTSLDTTATSISIYNDTASRIAVQIRHPSSAYAPSSDVRDIYVPAYTGEIVENVGVSKQIFLRSDSGSTITSGSVYFVVW